jgi:hypothetical protein
VSIARKTKALSSTIPDDYLHEMDFLSLSGAAGQKAKLKVERVVRSTPTSSSRCGTLVYIHTSGGKLTLDDSDVYLSEELNKYLMEDGFVLGDAMATAHGRKLASSTALSGFFNFLEDYEWQCDSVVKPGATHFKNYQAKLEISTSCNSGGKTCGSHFPFVPYKAGVGLDIDGGKKSFL